MTSDTKMSFLYYGNTYIYGGTFNFNNPQSIVRKDKVPAGTQRCFNVVFRLNFGHDVEQRWTNVVSTSNFQRLNRVDLWRWLNVENRLILVKFVNVEL